MIIMAAQSLRKMKIRRKDPLLESNNIKINYYTADIVSLFRWTHL
jgi:hypothetical protein